MVGTSLWGCDASFRIAIFSIWLPKILALLSTLLIHCGLSNAEWMLAMPAFAIRYLNAE